MKYLRLVSIVGLENGREVCYDGRRVDDVTTSRSTAPSSLRAWRGASKKGRPLLRAQNNLYKQQDRMSVWWYKNSPIWE